MVTVAQAQAVCDRQGGQMERYAPVATLTTFDDGSVSNCISAYAADGTFLANIAWRPHCLREYPPDGLLLC